MIKKELESFKQNMIKMKKDINDYKKNQEDSLHKQLQTNNPKATIMKT